MKLRIATVALAVFSAACSQDVASPRAPLAAKVSHLAAAANAQLIAAAQGRTARGFEDAILRMEGNIPGLGGVSLDSTGHIVVYLKDMTKRDAAMAQLRQVAPTLNVDGAFQSALGVEGRTVVRQGQFAFSDLVAWEQEILGHIRVPGVLALDADESRNRVRIIISEETSAPTLALAIAALGIPDSAILLQTGPKFIASTSLQDKHRATGGGQQIENTKSNICTLGANVDVQVSGLKGFLTAGHCNLDIYSLGNGATGDSIYQNVIGSSNLIGTVNDNPAWNAGGAFGCMGVTLCTGADAMFVLNTLETTDTLNWRKQIFSTSMWGTGDGNPGTLTINGQWRGISVNTLIYVGAPLYKVGRTTGVTYGSVSATCTDTQIVDTIPMVIGKHYVVQCADELDGAAAGDGDSGAPIFYPSDVFGDPPYVFGILFATSGTSGSTYCVTGCKILFSEWQNIETWLAKNFTP